MKNLILFYSRSGHNKKVAGELAQMIKADTDEIIDLDPKGFIISGWHAMKQRKTKIAPLKKNLDDYDQIILVSPFWVGGLPPTTRTFLESQPKLKKFALLSISGGGSKNEGFVDKTEKQYSVKIAPRLLISDPEFKKGAYKSALKEFADNLKA